MAHRSQTLRHRFPTLGVLADLPLGAVLCMPALGLSLVSLPASAAPSDELSEVEAMHERGLRRYEAADYDGATELWTEAYALIEPKPEYASIRADLIYNIAQAHARAFELDGDSVELKLSLDLLQRFRASLDNDEDAAEITKADEKIAALEARIAEPEAPDEATPAPDRSSDEAPAPVVQPPARTERVDVTPPPGRASIATGGVLIGLGGVGGAVAIAGAIMSASANDFSDIDASDLEARKQRLSTGQTGNSMALSGSIAAAVMVPTGVVLLVMGVVRNKKARSGQTALVPSIGPRAGGLALWGRF